MAKGGLAWICRRAVCPKIGAPFNAATAWVIPVDDLERVILVVDPGRCASLRPEMCGVVGIYGHPEAANLAYLGLYALQHRGQESAGIVSTDGERLRWVREMGHVNDIFTADRLAQLGGFAAIGHVRYSTAGESALKNAQPIAVDYSGGSVAVGHNGNLVNADTLRERLE